MDAYTTVWRPAKARDLRFRQAVRITFSDGHLIGKVMRKFRGWNANLETDDGGTFVISRHFSDWGTYDIEVPTGTYRAARLPSGGVVHLCDRAGFAVCGTRSAMGPAYSDRFYTLADVNCARCKKYV